MFCSNLRTTEGDYWWIQKGDGVTWQTSDITSELRSQKRLITRCAMIAERCSKTTLKAGIATKAAALRLISSAGFAGIATGKGMRRRCRVMNNGQAKITVTGRCCVRDESRSHPMPGMRRCGSPVDDREQEKILFLRLQDYGQRAVQAITYQSQPEQKCSRKASGPWWERFDAATWRGALSAGPRNAQHDHGDRVVKCENNQVLFIAAGLFLSRPWPNPERDDK